MPSRKCLDWNKAKIWRFKRDYTKGTNLKDMCKRYKMSKGAVISTAKYFGVFGNPRNEKIDDKLVQFVAELYPTNNYMTIQREVEEKFGRTICRKTIGNIASKMNLQKDENYMHEQLRENGRLGQPALREAMRRPEVRERLTIKLKQIYDKERWRIANGLEQKTKYNLNLNPELATKRCKVKMNLIKRNNYFSENGSRYLFYDAETKRSRLLEQRYKHMFYFVAADGFDEKESVFVKQHKNNQL